MNVSLDTANINVINISTSEPIYLFTIKDDDEDLSLIWTILTCPWTYIGTIGVIFAVCLVVYCFKRHGIRLSAVTS